MIFDVTYRNPETGKQEIVQIEAPSKADIWPILKERRITAISVKESSGRRQKQVTAKSSASALPMRGLLAAVVVVGAVAAWWVFRSDETAVVNEEKRQQVKQKPAKSVSAVPATNDVSKAVKEIKKVEEELDPAKRRVATLSFVTNSMGMIVERYKTADGKTHKRIRPSRPPVFKHMTDDLISMAMGSSGGGQMPPLPLSGNLDKEFLESLKDPIVINDDDTEEIKERKRIVAETRKEIDALMKQGISFRAILAEHEKVFNENAQIRAEANAELRKICEEGDAEGVQKYLDTINAAFQEMGIEELRMPKTKEERRAEIEARRAAREASKQKGK